MKRREKANKTFKQQDGSDVRRSRDLVNKKALEFSSAFACYGSDGLWVITCTVLILRLYSFPTTSSTESTFLIQKQNVSRNTKISSLLVTAIYDFVWFWMWLCITVVTNSFPQRIPE
ncbi:hypothetical protein KDA00_05565 [Candidatus Saccharibacteria bacterium]|nr:hypothetical protein [Candidatus Saccharibacteria bacterium]